MHRFRQLRVKSGGPEPVSLSEEQTVSVTVYIYTSYAGLFSKLAQPADSNEEEARLCC